MFGIKLNPITEKRIHRFKSLKRSYWSFWILVGLYVVSMLSNVLCNNLPLIVRYAGDTYFPIFKYYPDDLFTHSGINSRPDYKALNQSEAFQENESNFMIFPLIPFGPNEGVTADQLDVSDDVEIEISRKQLVATANLNTNFEIRKSSAMRTLFDVSGERDLRGSSFLGRFPLSDEFRSAVQQRIENNQELEGIEERMSVVGKGEYVVSLSAYSPRSRAPSSVRVTVREVVDKSVSERVVFTEEGEVDSESSKLWLLLSEEQKDELIATANLRRENLVQPISFDLEGVGYEAAFLKEDVFFPFRPIGEHRLGLDSSGRDVLVRIIYAMRISLNFGILLVISTMVVGIVVGAAQGYLGGRFDLIGQRAIEIWEAMPFLYVMILMGSVFGQSFALLLFVYGLFNWIGISYYMRGEFFKLRKQPFVEAAHCLGLPSWKIMVKHILPNSLVPVITFFPFSLVGAIGSLSALDYLGFGLPVPTPSWGELLGQAQEFRYAWWLVLYPSIILFVVVLLGVFIGEGLRAAFDPRVNSRYES